MLDIFLISLPVFLLLAAGYGIIKIGYLPVEMADHLNHFAVKVAVPVLLFRAMFQLDFGVAFNINMLLVFYLSAFACFFLAALSARKIWGRTPGEAVSIGFSAYFSNSVMLGIPIAERGFGQDVLTPVLGIVVLHAPILYTFGMMSMEFARRDGGSFGSTVGKALNSIFKNPLMIGILLGLLANLTSLRLPEFATAVMDMLAGAAIPVALISIGAALTQYQLKSEIGESVMILMVSLFVHPILTFVLCHFLLGLDPVYTKAAVIIACMPPGMNGYVFAVLYNRAIATASSSILLGTIVSVLSITGWLILLQGL